MFANGETLQFMGNPVLRIFNPCKTQGGNLQGIYTITNLITNEIYVGQSKNIKTRWLRHKRRAKDHKYSDYNKLYPSINKYGVENFELKVIKEMPNASKKQMLQEEDKLIKKLKTIENGLNCIDKDNHISYWKNKKRDPETNKKISKTLTGTILPQEIKNKIGKSNKLSMIGNKNGNKKVMCVETSRIFESSKAAAEWVGRNPSGISAVLVGRKKTCGGYHWKRIED